MIYENVFPSPASDNSIKSLRECLLKSIFKNYPPPLSSNLPKHAQHFLTDDNLTRYLVARDMDINKAAKVAINSWAWMEKRDMFTANLDDADSGK